MWKSLERGEGLRHTTDALDNILTGVGEGETQVHGQRKCLAGYDGDMCLLKDKPGERVRSLDNLTVKAAAFSESAKSKIEAAGGKAEVV